MDNRLTCPCCCAQSRRDRVICWSCCRILIDAPYSTTAATITSAATLPGISILCRLVGLALCVGMASGCSHQPVATNGTKTLNANAPVSISLPLILAPVVPKIGREAADALSALKAAAPEYKKYSFNKVSTKVEANDIDVTVSQEELGRMFFTANGGLGKSVLTHAEVLTLDGAVKDLISDQLKVRLPVVSGARFRLVALLQRGDSTVDFGQTGSPVAQSWSIEIHLLLVDTQKSAVYWCSKKVTGSGATLEDLPRSASEGISIEIQGLLNVATSKLGSTPNPSEPGNPEK
jgi:hypothetical protein